MALGWGESFRNGAKCLTVHSQLLDGFGQVLAASKSNIRVRTPSSCISCTQSKRLLFAQAMSDCLCKQNVALAPFVVGHWHSAHWRVANGTGGWNWYFDRANSVAISIISRHRMAACFLLSTGEHCCTMPVTEASPLIWMICLCNFITVQPLWWRYCRRQSVSNGKASELLPGTACLFRRPTYKEMLSVAMQTASSSVCFWIPLRVNFPAVQI